MALSVHSAIDSPVLIRPGSNDHRMHLLIRSLLKKAVTIKYSVCVCVFFLSVAENVEKTRGIKMKQKKENKRRRNETNVKSYWRNKYAYERKENGTNWKFALKICVQVNAFIYNQLSCCISKLVKDKIDIRMIHNHRVIYWIEVQIF